MSNDIQENDNLNDPDEISRACEIALRATSNAVLIARSHSKPESVPDGLGGRIVQAPGSDGVYPILHCVECDEPIPTARIKLGRVRCIDCQTQKEKKH